VKRFLAILAAIWGVVALGAEVIPSKPAKYLNDFANVISPGVASELNEQLAQFERDTSSQIVVAIYPKMQSDSSIEDYTFRVKETWGVGQKEKNNGAVLFIFIQDRKMFLQVNYGLEGVLPDALCKRIIADEITPRFKQQDFNGGVRAGVNAMLAAARGEYKGTGSTALEQRGGGGGSGDTAGAVGGLVFGILIFIILLALMTRRRRRRGWLVGGGGYTGGWWGGSSGWGGGSSGGGWSSGGSSGFFGGGGTGGGGGAGGSW
jgi:uncharacterized protein